MFSRGVSTRVTCTDLPSTVTVDTCNSALLRAQSRSSCSVVPFPSKFGGEDPAAAAARTEIRHLLEHAIDQLPPAFRVVYMMREVEECSVEETADQLGIKAQTVKTRLHRARRQLRLALHDRLADTLGEAFPFMGKRCARVTDAVMAQLDAEAGEG